MKTETEGLSREEFEKAWQALRPLPETYREAGWAMWQAAFSLKCDPPLKDTEPDSQVIGDWMAHAALLNQVIEDRISRGDFRGAAQKLRAMVEAIEAVPSTQPKCNCGAGGDAYLACHADVCALKKWAAPRYEISQETKEEWARRMAQTEVNKKWDEVAAQSFPGIYPTNLEGEMKVSTPELCRCEVIQKSHCPTCGLRRQPVISQATKEEWARRIAEAALSLRMHGPIRYARVLALMTNEGV